MRRWRGALVAGGIGCALGFIGAPSALAAPPTCPLGVKCYWVSQTGSDSAPGTAALPFRTVGQALSVANGGERIFVAAGDYPSFTDAKSRSSYVTVQGYDPTPLGVARPQIHPDSLDSTSVGDSASLFGDSFVKFDDFSFLDRVYISCNQDATLCGSDPTHDVTITNSQFTSINHHECVVLRLGASNVTLSGNYMHSCWSAIEGPGDDVADPTQRLMVKNIRITNNLMENEVNNGIGFGNWNNVEIDHNTIRFVSDPNGVYHNDGIQFYGNSTGVSIHDNVIHDTGQLLFVQNAIGPIDQVKVYNNLMYNSTAYAVQIGTASDLTFNENTVWTTAFGAMLVRGGFNGTPPGTNVVVADNVLQSLGMTDGATMAFEGYNLLGTAGAGFVPNHDIVGADPMFNNPAAGNYRPGPLSPVHHAGTATYGTTTDLDGTLRGNPPSMGAYE